MHGARIRSVVLLLAFAAAALTACGGNPAGSDSQGVVVRGTVQGAGTLRAASVGATSAATVTVTVLESNRSRNIEDVTQGRHVHVKGTWLPMEGSVQPVLAQEIILQGDDDTQGPGKTNCDAGQKMEVEGPISEKSGSIIPVNQQGKGLFACEVGSASIRKGNTTYPLAQLQTGWRVHVSGTATSLSGNVCNVSASEVKVQQN